MWSIAFNSTANEVGGKNSFTKRSLVIYVEFYKVFSAFTNWSSDETGGMPVLELA